MIDDEPSVCPFRTQAPVQDNYGRLQIISQTCDTRCPLCLVTPKFSQGKVEVDFSCGKQPTTVEATLLEDTGSKPTIKLAN
jgi:hypothetical protein